MPSPSVTGPSGPHISLSISCQLELWEQYSKLDLKAQQISCSYYVCADNFVHFCSTLQLATVNIHARNIYEGEGEVVPVLN
jgi:hypothetical protein